jgi:hypothetical protein
MTGAIPRAPDSGGPFIPCALMPVNVGPAMANLYPIIDPGMATHEHAHAFHINKTALLTQNIDLRIQLNALRHQLNPSAAVKGVINDWLQYFYDRWCDFQMLQILSFHNTKGDEVNNLANAANSSILLPVVDGGLNTCRKNVEFVRVQLSVNFVDFVTTVNPGHTTLCIKYFIEMPQTTHHMTNERGNVYNPTTFHGTSDLCTLDTQAVQAKIINYTLQEGQVELQAASFGATSARTVSSAIQIEIQEKILCLASASICHTMFTALCPGYSNQPHAVCEHNHQVHNDKDSNAVSTLVQAYYQQLLNASHPFSSQWEYPVSVCLDLSVVLTFVFSLAFVATFQIIVYAAHQQKVLQEMIQAAQLAEDNFLTTTRIAHEAVGLSQAFLTTSPGGGGLSNPIVGVYPSQAEDTIRRYTPIGGHSTDGSANTHDGDHRGRRPFAYHNCGSPHPWTEFKNGCDNPGVRKNAKRNIDCMKANRQKRHRQNTKQKNLGTANYYNFDSAGQERIKQQVLLSLKHGTCNVSNTASVASSVTTPSSVLPATNGGLGRGAPGGRVSGGSRIFIIDIPVLAARPALKPMMPIAIHSNLPHIVILFGMALDCPNSPSVHCAVDSCAALSTGNFHCFASLAKRFPHCLVKVFAPQDYAPIVPSGVVQSHQHKAVTTELVVGFQFHLPYKATTGEEASLLIATGPHVSVNTIRGLPFMQGTGMISTSSVTWQSASILTGQHSR